MFGALARYPAYRKLWFGAQAGSLGQWMQQVALGWLALQLTDSQAFVGIVAFMGGVPFLVLAIPAGVILDRFDRRDVMLICQALSVVIALVISADVLLGFVDPAHLIIAALATGSMQALLTPAQQSLVPSLVPREDLTNAIGLNSAGMNLTRIFGPSLAGVLIGLYGTSAAFLVQALALVIALGLIVRIPRVPRPSAVAAGGRAVFEGVTLIARREDLRALFLLACIPTFFAFPYISFLTIFARDILAIGPEGLGMLMATSGAGAVTGSLLVASRSSLTGKGRQLVAATVIYGLFVLGISMSRSVYLTLPLLYLAGLFGAMFMAGNNALLQLQVDDRVRGRVMSAYLLNMGLMPLGALPMGLLAGSFGAPVAVATGAIISSTLAAVLGFRSAAVRRL